MKPSVRPALLWLALGVVALAGAGCAAWRVNQSIELARRSEPLQQQPPSPTQRLLIVGDSTAVGTGASSPEHSLAGLIARRHPSLQITNLARDGAKFADVTAQLAAAPRHDIVLIQAGGNDVIRLRSEGDMRADVQRLLDAARERANVVLIMPAGNVGNAPFFFAPLSWWMTARSRAMHRIVEEEAARRGAVYVKLFEERADDPFVQRPELNAADGLHPSDGGYQVWWQVLQRQAPVWANTGAR